MDKSTYDMLEAKGPEKVREEMCRGLHGMHNSPLRNSVEDWLRTKQAMADAEASLKRDAREEETLSIAREANRIASRAERWAMYAAIAAVVALIISIARSSS